MGHRANLVIVNAIGYELYFCHGCAISIPEDIFWGPEAAMAYIRSQEQVPVDSWLNETWAEGGVLIDTEHKVLLLYGGQDMLYDIPLRRMYLELIAEVWGRWTMRWAYDGIAEIGAYVGIRRDKFTALTDDVDDNSGLSEIERQEWTSVICSIRQEDGTLMLYPESVAYPDMLLTKGTNLITSSAQVTAYEALPLDEWDLESFPLGGLHIDIPQHHLSYWSARDGDLRPNIQSHWPDWKIFWLKDSYERHVELAEHKFTLPVVSEDVLLDQIRSRIMSARRNGTELPHNLAVRELQVQLNRNAQVDHLHQAPADVRQQIFDRAVARRKARKEHGRLA